MNGFALWVGFGAGLGLWRLSRVSPQRQAVNWVNLGLLVLFAALIGARLFYVWENWAYFSTNMVDIPKFHLGGLAWPGAVGASWLVLLILAVTNRGPHGQRASIGWFADCLYPLLPPLMISIWLGCWSANVAYGPNAPENAWWAITSMDENGVFGPRWPLQPLAAFSLILLFWLLETRFPQRPSGRLSGMAAFAALLHLLLASFLRADPTPTWRGFSIETWAAFFFLAAFCLMILFIFVSSRVLLKRAAITRPIDP